MAIPKVKHVIKIMTKECIVKRILEMVALMPFTPLLLL